MLCYYTWRRRNSNSYPKSYGVVVVQSPSFFQLFATPWSAALQASAPPKVCPSLCSLHRWCHPAISSSDALFSFCPQSFPESGTFPMSWLFTSDQNNGASASTSALAMSIHGWFPLRLTGLVSLLFKELSGAFSSTTAQRNQILQCSAFFMVHLSQLYMTTGRLYCVPKIKCKFKHD